MFLVEFSITGMLQPNKSAMNGWWRGWYASALKMFTFFIFFFFICKMKMMFYNLLQSLQNNCMIIILLYCNTSLSLNKKGRREGKRKKKTNIIMLYFLVIFFLRNSHLLLILHQSHFFIQIYLQALLHREAVIVQSTFGLWRHRTEEVLSIAGKMDEAERHYLFALCSKALVAWRQYVAEQKTQ